MYPKPEQTNDCLDIFNIHTGDATLHIRFLSKSAKMLHVRHILLSFYFKTALKF